MKTAAPPRAFGWRECLLLSLPALVVGAALRLCLLNAIPEAFYGADSPSYFEATYKIWSGDRGSYIFAAKRRWLYPMFLVPLPVLPISPARSIPLLQHLLGLATILGIGWVAGSLTRLRALWVPLITLLAAVWPKMLWYEHEVGAEALFLALFVLAAALAMPSGSLRDRKRLFWFLLAAAAVAAVKPHGRGIWLGCVLFAAWVTRHPLRWDVKCWCAVAAGALAVLTSGDKEQGNWLLLDSALPLVNLDAPKWQPYREALRPLVLKARADLDQYPWRQGDYKKPLADSNPAKIGPVWAGLTRRRAEFSKVCGDLAKGAVFPHPFTFARFTFTKIGISFANAMKIYRMNPPGFEEDQATQDWQTAGPQLKLFYRMDQPQYEAMAKAEAARTNPALPFLKGFSKWLDWARDSTDPATGRHWLGVGWLGGTALAGLLLCLLQPGTAQATAVLWLPSFLYLTTVFAVGDWNSRYTQPVEWIGLLLPMIALDSLLARARNKKELPSGR